MTQSLRNPAQVPNIFPHSVLFLMVSNMNSREGNPSASDNDGIKEERTRIENADSLHEQNQQPLYPKPLILGLVVATLCIATFLCGLDQTIVATAAPKITKSFNALGDIAWWTSAYL
jgi:hypothetical protein